MTCVKRAKGVDDCLRGRLCYNDSTLGRKGVYREPPRRASTNCSIVAQIKAHPIQSHGERSVCLSVLIRNDSYSFPKKRGTYVENTSTFHTEIFGCLFIVPVQSYPAIAPARSWETRKGRTISTFSQHELFGFGEGGREIGFRRVGENLHLLAAEDESLLGRRDSFLLFDSFLDPLDLVGLFDIQLDLCDPSKKGDADDAMLQGSERTTMTFDR